MGHQTDSNYRSDAAAGRLRHVVWLESRLVQKPGHAVCYLRPNVGGYCQGSDQTGWQDSDQAGNTGRTKHPTVQARQSHYRLEEQSQGRGILLGQCTHWRIVRVGAGVHDGPHRFGHAVGNSRVGQQAGHGQEEEFDAKGNFRHGQSAAQCAEFGTVVSVCVA